MNCPKCDKPMRNLGNVSGVIRASFPPQWEEVYVCEECKVKKTVHVKQYCVSVYDLSKYEETK